MLRAEGRTLASRVTVVLACLCLTGCNRAAVRIPGASCPFPPPRLTPVATRSYAVPTPGCDARPHLPPRQTDVRR